MLLKANKALCRMWEVDISKRKNIVKKVNEYLKNNDIFADKPEYCRYITKGNRFIMGDLWFNPKYLSVSDKVTFYYNFLASLDENPWQDFTEFPSESLMDLLNFLCDTKDHIEIWYDMFSERKDGGRIDIYDFLEYQIEIEKRGSNITFNDYMLCINNDDLVQSDWIKLVGLIQEKSMNYRPLYAPTFAQLLYEQMQDGLTIGDVWKWQQKYPRRNMFRLINTSTEYIKDCVRSA